MIIPRIPSVEDFRLVEVPRQMELDRLEREIKFSDDPEIRKAATRRFLELTDKEFAQ